MSTTTKPTKLDPRVYHPLGQLRGAIRRYVTIEGLATVGLFLASWFWLGLILDYGLFKLTAFDWVVDAHPGFRWVALIGSLSGLAALVFTRLFIRLTRDFSSRALALVLEKRFPNLLGDRLITAVELADTRKAATYGYSEEMILETIRDVRGRVGQIPVSKVFNWKRLWLRMGVVFAASVGIFAVVSMFFILGLSLRPGRYLLKFADVSVTWAERNILLQDVPWPRNTFLEILEPVEDDKRIGRDRPELTIRVVAYKWVWADTNANGGWRPLTWGDLPKALPDEKIPSLPIEPLKAVVKTAPFLTGGIYSAAPQLELPIDLENVPEDLNAWRADRVEILLTKNEKLKEFLTKSSKTTQPLVTEESLKAILEVFAKLEDRADEPSMSRTLRKLEIPDEAVLRHRGEKTKGEKAAKPDKYNEFAFTLSSLQESVNYTVRGGDFITPQRRITLVDAPAITSLKLNEYRPAYFYYLPPYKDGNATTTTPALLKDRKQEFLDQTVSLTGGKSNISIYVGTDLSFVVETDKELLSATLTPTINLFPGVDARDQADPIPLKLDPGKKKFSVSFAGKDGKPLAFWQNEIRKLKTGESLPQNWDPVLSQIMRPLEFELTMTDTDKVTSRRTISIQTQDDKGPEVNIAVTGLRKVGPNYLCSANAMIPLSNDSSARDDFGLHKLEYTYTYSKIEQQVVLAEHLELLSLMWAQSPAPASFGDFIYRSAFLSQAIPRLKSPTPTTVEQSVSIPSFEEKYLKKADGAIYTLQNLEALLKQPLPEPFSYPTTTYYPFGGEKDEVFDLMARLPNLATGDPQAQPSYQLLLNVTATDSNVQFGPRTAQNKEPIAVKIISYGELLAEISADQKRLAGLMDEAIKKLKTSQNSLNDVALRSSSGSTGFEDLSSRCATIEEEMKKSNDFLIDVTVGYDKIMEEYRINRFEKYKDKLIPDTRKLIVDPMRDVVQNDGFYTRSERAMVAFHAILNQSQAPDQATTSLAQLRLVELIAKLEEIRRTMGESIDYTALVGNLKETVRKQEMQGKTIVEQREDYQRRIFNFTFLSLGKNLTIKQGGSVKLTLNFLLPEVVENDPSLKFEVPPASGLKVTPDNVTLKEQPRDQQLPLEITAGMVPGKYILKIVTSQHQGREIEITVTP